MLISTKRYVVTTEVLNCYLFRVLTAGIDLKQYSNNSILLFMHQRAMGIKTDEILPVGVAIDLQVEGDRITTKLGFDEKDEFAVKLYNKYEAGILNMLSPGLKPLEWSEEPDMMLPGQIGPTVTKSILIEISCVDIGANPEAYAVALYDDTDKLIQLSALNQYIPTLLKNNPDMKLITLKAPEILAMLKLNAETATEQEVQNEIQRVITLSGTLATENQTLKSNATATAEKLKTAEDALEANVKLQAADERAKLIADAEKDRKITKEEGVLLLELSDNTEKLKKLLDSKKPNPAIQTVIALADKKDGKNAEFIKLTEMSYDELFAIEGGLAKLKAYDAEIYQQKMDEKFKK